MRLILDFSRLNMWHSAERFELQRHILEIYDTVKTVAVWFSPSCRRRCSGNILTSVTKFVVALLSVFSMGVASA